MSSPASKTRADETSGPALTRRPEATTLSIEDLLQHVEAGRVRVPRFQRPLEWEANDIKLLLDSIYQGYPIGTLLFWKRPAEADTIQLGPVRLDVPTRQDALWVVDGQQRITALTGVLKGDYHDRAADHVLFFDLASGTFERAGKKKPPRPGWLPLNVVVDSAELLAHLHAHPELEPAWVKAAIELGKRVREYQVPAYVVDTPDEEPLRQIFNRINTGGKPLGPERVFEALHGGRHEAPSGLRAIADALEQTGFGRIEEDFIHKALLAITGKDVGRARSATFADDEAAAALPRTQAALRRTVVFLQKHADIPHVRLMPYKLPLVTMARFFDLHPEPHPRSLELLSRWLWRGAVSGRHQGSTVATRKTLGAIGPDESASVQQLLRDVGGRPAEPPALTPYHFRHARSKLHTLALWALAPAHLVTGARLSIAELIAGDADDTPGQQVVRHGAAGVSHERLRGLTNVVLHPPLPKLRRALADQTDPAVLRSHSVSAEAHAALRAGRLDEFLGLREATLSAHVEQFLAARAQWDAGDRPPIATLVVED